MNAKLNDTRRDFLKAAVALPAATAAPWAMAQDSSAAPAAPVMPTAGQDISPVDRVFITRAVSF